MDQITHDPAVLGGKPRIRGLQVTVGPILGLLFSPPAEAANGIAFEQEPTVDVDHESPVTGAEVC